MRAIAIVRAPCHAALMRFGTMRVQAIELLGSPAPGVSYLGPAPVSHPVENDRYTSGGESALFVDGHVSWRSPTMVVSTGRYSIYCGEITW